MDRRVEGEGWGGEAAEGVPLVERAEWGEARRGAREFGWEEVRLAEAGRRLRLVLNSKSLQRARC